MMNPINVAKFNFIYHWLSIDIMFTFSSTIHTIHLCTPSSTRHGRTHPQSSLGSAPVQTLAPWCQISCNHSVLLSFGHCFGTLKHGLTRSSSVLRGDPLAYPFWKEEPWLNFPAWGYCPSWICRATHLETSWLRHPISSRWELRRRWRREMRSQWRVSLLL